MNIDKLLKEAYEEVKQEIADGTLKLGEAKKFKVDPKYTHFAVDKATGKILTGWEYKDLDPQSIATYVKGDLKDMDIKPSDVTIKTVGSLKAKGIDPFNWESWNKTNNPTTEATVVISTPDGAAPTDPLKKKQATDATKVGDTVKYVKPGLAEAADQEDFGITDQSAGGILKVKFSNSKPEARQIIKALVSNDSVSDDKTYIKNIKKVGQDYVIEIKSKTPEFNELKKAVSRLDRVDGIPEDAFECVSKIIGKADGSGTVKDIKANRKSEAKPYEPLKEAADEPTDAEQEAPAEEQGSISDKLSELISQAIDAAGEVISSSEDTKMETALGKVVKNLTSAQDALVKVTEHEQKLNEKVQAEKSKSLEKYTKDFLKGLRKYTKDDALINKLQRTYNSMLAPAMEKQKPADKLSEKIWGHFTLNEGKK